MSDQNDQQREWEFVMEGITTRMNNAMEKISESNRMLRSTVKYVCLMTLAVLLIVVAGFIIQNRLWFKHVDHIRSEVSVVEESVAEEIPQLGQTTDDR